MKERLVKLIGEKNTERLLLGTFHTLCSRILRRFGSLVNVDPSFTIADTQTSQEIITQLRSDPKTPIDDFTRTKQKVGAIWGLISKAKSKGYTAARYAKDFGSEFKTKNIAILYTKYEEKLEQLNLVDFDNLLLKGCELFVKKKDVLSNIKAVLVDEYQDTNVVQYDLIKLIMTQVNDKIITIVGDPDQSIFGWRSAEPKNFNKMVCDFDKTMAIHMEQNYRSTSTILDSALHVISQDRTRIDKALYTNNPKGIPIVLNRPKNEFSQATFVAKEISRVIKYSKGLINYKDIAVLMRMNFISQQFEQVFRSHKIPFTIVGGDRFFDRVEIKDVICYLRFAYNPCDYLSFARIVNVPRRGIGAVTLKKLVDFNDKQGGSILDSLQKIVTGKDKSVVSPAVSKKLKGLVDICSEIRRLIDEREEMHEIIRYIVEATEYKEYLKEHHFQDHESRWSNIGELISIAKGKPNEEEYKDSESELNESTTVIDMEEEVDDNSPKGHATITEDGVTIIEMEEEPDDVEEVDVTEATDEDRSQSQAKQSQFETHPSSSSSQSQNFTDNDDLFDVKDPVADFLEYCSLCSNQKELEEAEGGKVTIATLHSSKGLEWPCVFIATCNEGVIPHSMAEDVSEEGRLLYVGMTRSKFLLYCVSPIERNSWGRIETESMSGYLRNLDRSLYTTTVPDWDDSVRAMLATTIDKPIPPPDSELVTTKKGKKTKNDENYNNRDSNTMRFEFKRNCEQFGGFTSASTLYRQSDNKRFKKHN
ncbi:P-loop containing nucleoside triphosphate hydrolase protein [Choanephora cucurbitarum]|nr:P-loop containing nucleoside triphosphate hydrolase protein [Choanephora cucurbitarum]